MSRQRVLANWKRIDESTRARERFDFILEGAGLGAWDWDLTTDQVNFDRRWCEMLGLDFQTTPQCFSTWSERVHRDDLAGALEDVSRHLAGETSRYENVHRMRHADGHWIHILDTGRVSGRDASGRPVRFTGTHFDISRQKQIELELRRTTLQLEDAQSVASIGSWEFDVESGAITWSRQMFEFFPERWEDGPPTYERHASTIHPDDRPLFLSTIAAALGDGKPYDFRYRCEKEGRTRWLEGRGRAVLDDSQRVIGLRGTCRDITDQVELERSLELARQKSMQSSKFVSLGEMAAGVAHEINNPLAIIGGRADQLTEMILSGSATPESSLAALESIRRTTDRIGKIVRGLRAFSRNAEGDPMTENPLRTLIEESLELCRERFKHHEITLRVEGNADAVVSCRPAQIAQIVMNLLSNSFDAVVGQNERWVLLESGETPEGAVFLSVTDSGPGIPSHLAEKIMLPFFTTKDVGKGTGLGLSVSKGIAEDHGGRLWFDASSAHTRLVLELPLVRRGSLSAA